MDDVEIVKVSKCQGHILAKMKLDTATQRNSGNLQEMGEALVHQLHKQDRLVGSRFLAYPKMLDNVGMLDALEVLTLLVEAFLEGQGGWVIMEDGVEDLGSAWQLITLGSVDCSVSPPP